MVQEHTGVGWRCDAGHGPFEEVPTVWDADTVKVADTNDKACLEIIVLVLKGSLQDTEYVVAIRHKGIQQLLPDEHTLAKHFELLEKHTAEELRNIYRELVRQLLH